MYFQIRDTNTYDNYGLDNPFHNYKAAKINSAIKKINFLSKNSTTIF